MFTPMAEPCIPEGIVRFTHALVEDASLRSWFLSLEQLSASVRRAAFAQMATQMQAEREDPELVAAVAAMIRSELFDAVRDSLRERCGV
jgi:hypothetical protein